MKLHWLLCGIACVALSPFAGVADEISWTFQRTGFINYAQKPQTALAMRSNLNWPVIFSADYNNQLSAYSLFSVPSPYDQPAQGPRTNWHRIGTNLTQGFIPSDEVYLQATSGSPDGFAVSVQTQHQSSNMFNAVVRGTSFGGFQTPLLDIQAAKFDGSGNLVTATNDTPPGLTYGHKVYDIAKSPLGDTGLISQSADFGGAVTFWQKTRLLGDTWLSTPLNNPGESSLFGASLDLAYDSASRPHVVGLNASQEFNSVVAYHFDVVSGGWLSSTLDTASYPGIADVATAANDQGIVGAAWVNDGTLKYALFDGNQPNPQWTVTTVANFLPGGSAIREAQGVGLAFDRLGLPVISFVAEQSNEIWIAYDPPVTAPIAGDFNHDGFVDGDDLDIWKTAFAGATASADADGDGDSDGADFLAWQRNFAPSSGATAANVAVPEPLSLVSSLTAIVAIAVASRRPRHCLQL
ncbi:hypothetical protein [Lacipirellula parvula]|uniref:PEP-CTERM protein-sorting domain-containing protein n=1 Tax=Lacipirellula parvula TaxID=2650471 RepID=A0A5K7XI42_9BACT|nr:hypothetical protein [Lacipirellula parvula]BBO36550.1 hypothetical protein PLANPX_6162 [Lacipirellula parvula]